MILEIITIIFFLGIIIYLSCKENDNDDLYSNGYGG